MQTFRNLRTMHFEVVRVSFVLRVCLSPFSCPRLMHAKHNSFFLSLSRATLCHSSLFEFVLAPTEPVAFLFIVMFVHPSALCPYARARVNGQGLPDVLR
jgi:hypothetical protein